MLLGHHYQNGYVCDDIEAGIAAFRGRCPINVPPVYEIDQPIDWPNGEVINSLNLCFILINNLQYELI